MQGITDKKQFLAYIVILAAIVLVVNIVSRSLFFRLDLTDTRMYSLSESSKKVIASLDDRMLVKVYFSKDLPGQVANSRRFLQDLLEEYAAYSNGEFNFEFISPDDNETIQADARNNGIPPVQMQVVENDKLEIKNVYMGMVLLYNDKKEVIPMIKTSSGLEYEITTHIKKLTASGMNTVAVASSENESVAVEKLTETLRQTYKVKNVDLSKPVPSDVRVLIMNGFTDSLSNDELYNLDQYVMAGGKFMLGQTRQKADLQQGYAQEINSNIFDLLSAYGVNIGNEILTDKNCGQIQIQQQQGFFRMVNAIEYPVFPIINRFNKDEITVSGLEAMRVFFPNEILPGDSGAVFNWLGRTSDRTGLLSGPYYNVYPIDNPQMKIFDQEGRIIAARINTSVKSYFADDSAYNKSERFLSMNPNAEFIVVGDLEFFNDNRAGGIPENVEFIQNAVDYLSGDAELVQIRSRAVTSRPINELSDAKRQVWKWLNILLPALLVLVTGIYRLKKRNDHRKNLEELYG